MSEPPPEDRRRCAVCGKPQEARFKPFCSRRCRDVDLGRWLKGGYAIPAQDEPEPGSESGDSDDNG
jgi:hypothetical protein